MPQRPDPRPLPGPTAARTGTTPLRCLVVDDQRLLVELLTTMLSAIPGLSISGTATSCAEALNQVASDPPDLLLLDLALGDGNGLSVARALVQQRPEAQVVVLSGQATTFVCPPELQNSVCAVIDKTAAFHDLSAALQRCLQRRTPGLTARQQEIYRLIGQGLSNKDIARQTNLALSTVETHRKQIARKLGVSGAELVRQAALLGTASEPC